MVRALTILNESGDTTIVWDEKADDVMEAIIRKKMEEGMTFFIIEPRTHGLLQSKKTQLVDAADARKHRALSIRDEDLAAFVSGGHGDSVPTPQEPVVTVERTEDPIKVARSQAVATKPRKGG